MGFDVRETCPKNTFKINILVYKILSFYQILKQSNFVQSEY